MGPVNWLAVIMAAVLALVVGMAWRALWVRIASPVPAREPPFASHFLATAAVFLIASTMLGHAFARIGGETLAQKPWLYFMQSGGIAVAFVIPAVLLAERRPDIGRARRLGDGGFWLITYLAMGAAFWALG